MSKEASQLTCDFCGVAIDSPYISYWTPGNYCDKCGSDYEGGVICEMNEANACASYENEQGA